MKTCKKCGATLSIGASDCAKCGTPLNAPNSVQRPTNSTSQAPKPSQSKRRQSGWLIVPALLLLASQIYLGYAKTGKLDAFHYLVIGLAAAVAAWFWIPRSKSEPQTTDDERTQANASDQNNRGIK